MRAQKTKASLCRRQMGKALILENLGLGLYRIRVLHDRVKADKALADIESWLLKIETQISALPAFDPDHKLPALKLRKASLLKQKEYLELIPGDPETTAWCVDYSTELTGEVGTIEINGEHNAILIQPGWRGNAAYNADRDGQSQNIRAMTAEQAFYNMAMKPGWQKWRPTYRIGTITEIDKCLCNVEMDVARTSIVNFGETRTINKYDALVGVPISYMDCDGTVFYEGDRVVVRFGGHDNDYPEIIGFESYPRINDPPIIMYSAYRVGDADTGSYYIGAFDTSGALLSTLDVNALVGVPANMPLMVLGAHEETNSVYVTGAEYRDWGDGLGEVLHPALFRMPIVWWYQGLQLKQFGAAPQGMVTALGITAGGYLLMSYESPLSSSARTGPGTHLMGFATYYPHNKVETVVLPEIWTDIDDDQELDEGEMFPADYKKYYNTTRGIGFLGHRCIVAMSYGYDATPDGGTPPNEWYSPESVDNHVDSWLAVWTYPRYPTPPIFPNTDLTPYFTSADPKWLDFFINRYADWGPWAHDPAYYTVRGTWQIIGFEGRLYVITLSFIQVFNAAGYVKTVNGWNTTGYSHYDWGKFVKYDGITLFACRFKASSSSSDNTSSPVYFFEAENFTLFTSVSLSRNDPLLGGKVAVCNVPIICTMLDRYNELRHEHDLYPVAFSKELSAVCQAHLDWCLERGRQQHIGAGGKYPVERGIAAGFNSADEVLMGMMAQNRVFEEVATCMAGWRASPTHWASINKPEQVLMGFAVGTYPESVTKIIQGAGLYDPGTGTYSTGDTIQELAPEAIGKTKLYCMMVCMD
jgi:hypothetical protein